MKSSPSVSQLGGIIATFLRTYHIILYSLTIVIGVSAAIFFLSNLVTLSGTASNAEQKTYPIDKNTIKQIDNYQSRHEASGRSFSPKNGRINPFVE
ncbi:MAG: hypothetical protein Q4A37_00665 [Candidatus Saccharibacteria bacterium]|nr:hypothetical protein [Candidatus Saccharibacteria bacterium]